MKILILGDLHGMWEDTNVTIAKAIRQHPGISHIIQVGDFGFGWPNTKPFKVNQSLFTPETISIYHAAEKFFIDGNHENFNKLYADNGAWQPDWQYMSRGSVLEIEGKRILFFGGASSIDKDMRIPHVSWWSDESITYSQIQKTLDSVRGPIDAIFSHEHPISVPYSEKWYNGDIFGKSDKDFLEVLKQHYKPKWQFFGHHHKFDTGTVDGTKWFCCPIIESLQYVIWDGNKAYLDS